MSYLCYEGSGVNYRGVVETSIDRPGHVLQIFGCSNLSTVRVEPLTDTSLGEDLNPCVVIVVGVRVDLLVDECAIAVMDMTKSPRVEPAGMKECCRPVGKSSIHQGAGATSRFSGRGLPLRKLATRAAGRLDFILI